MSIETVTCPDQPRYEGDLVGCGAAFDQKPDDEGWFDCPQCGLFFNKEGLTKPKPTHENALNACITYVIHGSADFTGMHPGLVDYFKKAVDERVSREGGSNAN